jgi:superfamily II DNA or RNA helicase
MDSAQPREARPYQTRAIVNLRAHVIMGKKRILAVGPTGCGKAFLVAAITKSSTIPMLFIAHREELIEGAARQLASFGLTNIGIIRGADERYNPSASIQVASIATLARRDKPFLDAPLVLIFCDEAHRAASDSYREVIFQSYPNAIVIGLTATPTRLDNRPLGGDLFEVIEIIATYEELFKHPDWLARPDVYDAPIRPDLSQVRIAGSDFDEEQLGEIMRTNELEGQIVDQWLSKAHRHPVFTKKGERVPQQFVDGERRKTLAFLVNVAHSQSVAARFEKIIGRKVAHLDSKTPSETRKAIWRDLASGELEVVCNCAIAIEGVDVPEIKCVISGKPTQSMVAWRQQTGREMRPWRGIIPILLDHGRNFERLGCPFEDLRWSLTARPVRYGGKLPMRLCRQCFAYVEPHKVVCPFCGFEFPKADDRPMPAETSVELELRNTEPDALKAAFFQRQVTLAKTRGFKPGFASAMYKEYYGSWPPREWGDRIKAEFSSDGAWQMSLERRLEKKSLREKREAEEDAAMAASETKEEKFKRLSKAEQHVLIVYVSGGADPRVKTSWYPLKKEACERFVRCGWLTFDGTHYEMTEAGRTACGWLVEKKSPEEEALEQTLAIVEGESEFADWLGTEGITAPVTVPEPLAPRPTRDHYCHARGCTTQVKPELLMCAKDWKRVPKAIQGAVWDHYRAGQCQDMNPSEKWHQAADAAIGYVAMLDGQKVRAVEAEAMRAFGCEPPPERTMPEEPYVPGDSEIPF